MFFPSKIVQQQVIALVVQQQVILPPPKNITWLLPWVILLGCYV